MTLSLVYLRMGCFGGVADNEPWLVNPLQIYNKYSNFRYSTYFLLSNGQTDHLDIIIIISLVPRQDGSWFHISAVRPRFLIALAPPSPLQTTPRTPHLTSSDENPRRRDEEGDILSGSKILTLTWFLFKRGSKTVRTTKDL